MLANSFHCPGCNVLLKPAAPVPSGKKIKCPKCNAVFTLKPKSEAGAPVPKPAQPEAIDSLPEADPLPEAEAFPENDGWEVLDNEPVEDEQDARPAVARRRRADEDLDEEEEEEDRPRARRGRRDLDDEDDEPPARRKRRVEADEEAWDEEEEDSEDDWDEEEVPGRKRASAGGNAIVVALIATLVTGLVLAGGVGGGVWWYINRDRNRGTGNEVPMAYIPADSDFVLGLDFGALISQPAIAAKIQEFAQRDVKGDFLQDCKAKTGLEMQELFDRVIVAYHFEPGRAAVTPFTMIAKSTRPFKQSRIRDSLKDPQTSQAHRFHGKTYFAVSNQFVYMPSDRIIVMSTLPEAQFQNLLTGDGTEVSFSSTALGLVKDPEQKLAWLALPVTSKLKNAGQEPGNAAPGGQQVQTQLKETLFNSKAIGLWIELNGDQFKCNWAASCTDGVAADKLVKAIQPMFAELKSPQAVIAMALLPKSIQNLAKEFSDTLTFSTQGNLAQVSFRVKKQSLEALANDPQLQAMQAGMQPGGPAGMPRGAGGMPRGAAGMPGAGAGRGGMAPRMGGGRGRFQGPGGGK
jgi:hypothetical protein